MLHSRQRPPRRSVRRATHEDPYSPTSRDYEERHKAHVSEMPDIPGLVRVDIGAPARKQN